MPTDDPKHLLDWYAKTGHETLKVEWAEEVLWPMGAPLARFQLNVNEWDMGSQRFGMYRYHECGKVWSQTSTIHAHQAACLIRNALRVGLEKDRIFVVAENKTGWATQAYFIRWHRHPEWGWAYLSQHGDWIRGPDDFGGMVRFDEGEHDEAATAAWDALQKENADGTD